jgi:hypothetical protein
MTQPVRDRDQEDGEEISQAWSRGAEWADDQITAVDALRLRGEKEWPWQVIVPVMEFIREEPLESALTDAITRALNGVRGVREAAQEDREVWVIAGRARGKALVAAVAAVLDPLEARLRQHIDSIPTE